MINRLGIFLVVLTSMVILICFVACSVDEMEPGTPGITGWGTAELTEKDDTGGTESAQVALDTNGNAVAVWHQYDGTCYNTCANRYMVP